MYLSFLFDYQVLASPRLASSPPSAPAALPVRVSSTPSVGQNILAGHEVRMVEERSPGPALTEIPPQPDVDAPGVASENVTLTRQADRASAPVARRMPLRCREER